MNDAAVTIFWSRVIRTPDCYWWRGFHGPDGYARVWWNGASRYAHRVAYEIEGGEVPEGKELDHLCRNRGCVRPDHLEPVTHAENMRRSPLVTDRGPLCKRGHLLDYVGPSGRRGCRRCRYAAVQRWRQRKEAVA